MGRPRGRHERPRGGNQPRGSVSAGRLPVVRGCASYASSMTARPAIRILLLICITFVVAFLILVLVQAPQATDVVTLIVFQGLGPLAGFASIAGVVWAVFVVIGSIRFRDRPRGTRILWFIASAVVAASINAVVVSALSAGADGWGGVIAAIAIGVALVFTASAVVATLLVELLILRERPTPPRVS